MYAMLFGLIEIFAFGVTEPTAAVEPVKTSPAQASVQVVVDHGLLKSRCSGTAIGPNLVVTCWHAFRDKGSVSVNGKPAKLLRFDAVSDVALIETNETLPHVSVASKPLAKGESATAYGYEYIRSGLWKFPTRITAVNRYSGFPNVSILGRPNQGRSGGGLFNESGELVGVCSASDGNEGLYCGLEAVKAIVNPTVKESQTVQVTKQADRKSVPEVVQGAAMPLVQSCPDGRCPLLPKLGSSQKPPMKSNTPTLAPPDCTCANCQCRKAPAMRSVMKQPVRTVVRWRPFQRLFGRR